MGVGLDPFLRNTAKRVLVKKIVGKKDLLPIASVTEHKRASLKRIQTKRKKKKSQSH
jgi:hypothetical protein